MLGIAMVRTNESAPRLSAHHDLIPRNLQSSVGCVPRVYSAPGWWTKLSGRGVQPLALMKRVTQIMQRVPSQVIGAGLNSASEVCSRHFQCAIGRQLII